MSHVDTIISAVFAFLSWFATVRGNRQILKNHGRVGAAINSLVQILTFAGKQVNNDGAKSGSDSGSGSSSSSS